MPVNKSKKIKYLNEYKPYPFKVIKIDLTLDMTLDKTQVKAKIQFERNPLSTEKHADLCLNGRDLKLLTIALDGTPLPTDRCILTPEHLTISKCPDKFYLDTLVEIQPSANTSLEGLYSSGKILCSQCEAEGFRKITFFPDRPDVMARYRCKLIADANDFPILLSNGNLIDSGTLENGKHYAIWEDPFVKPAYLFAVVAGDLVCKEDKFTTKSGREVSLKIYVESQNQDKCSHALTSLKKAMAWDEKRYGLEYDLDIYMIVAVDDFNMGAMENKGLNLFNAKYVLAQPNTATDSDYHLIEAVIGHEYFHNWTGNRVTCRDWFQLSLKEGLTVFREQEFSGESISSDVQRIQDVTLLRDNQFPEDAGPTAHPVQPDSYLEINNFYTLTIYEKGSELVGMIKRIVGEKNYHRGIDLYFKRHDGQAVTVDDFVAAMESAANRDLSQFKRWYKQAGTPLVQVEGVHDPDKQTYQLTVKQHCPPTPGQHEKDTFHIPIAMGLLDREGSQLPLILEGETKTDKVSTERVLEITKEQEVFTFTAIANPPVPSLLRGFSAPVRMKVNLTDEELAFLWSHDSDTFNRWEGGQELATRLLLTLIESNSSPENIAITQVESFVQAFATTLNDCKLDPAPRTLALTLPSNRTLLDRAKAPDPQRIHTIREWLRNKLGNRLEASFKTVLDDYSEQKPYNYNAKDAGRRSLKNQALAYLISSNNIDYRKLALERYHKADNMTDRLGAMSPLTAIECSERVEVLAHFEDVWQNDMLVMDKWFSLQAAAPLPDTLSRVQKLMDHSRFTMKTPNRVRSLIGAFCHSNPYCFHDISGDGYRFLADNVLQLNQINPQIAARLLTSMSQWRRFSSKRQKIMRSELERIASHSKLSRDVYEIVNKILG
ncbi:MAG: aminopeptidase N [Magnetococcales bacterium]|nr:aminopeptidase N [Magnetococcales bacterium]